MAETLERNPHAAVRPDWLALRTEAIIEPELKIVDPHHHLWDRQDNRYLFHDLLADMNAGHNVVSTVFVQCRTMLRAEGPAALAPLGEVEFVTGIAAMSASGIYGAARACAGIVAGADLQLGEKVAPVLELMAHSAGGRLRGVRNPVVWHSSPAVQSSTASPKSEWWLSPVMGFCTGVLMGATGIATLPVAPYFAALGLNKDDLIQALGLSFTVSSFALAVGLFVTGQFQMTVAAASLVALIPAFAGMFLGQKLRNRMPQELFKKCFFGGLLILGAYMTYRAITLM